MASLPRLEFDKRLAHVKRLFAISKDSDGFEVEDRSMWLDMYRIDQCTYVDEKGIKFAVYLLWKDEPEDVQQTTKDSEENLALYGRILSTKRLTDPQQDLEDGAEPDFWFNVPIIDEITLEDRTLLTKNAPEVRKLKFINDNFELLNLLGGPEPPEGAKIAKRKLWIRRVTHWDTDDYLDGENVYVPALEYKRKGSEDTNQYIDQEIPQIIHVENNVIPENKRFTVIMFNFDMAKNFRNITVETIKEERQDKFPPIRLDPFQTIVNCQMKQIYAQDLWCFGYGGPAGPCHRVFGVRNSKFVEITDSAGTYFDSAYIDGFGFNLQTVRESVLTSGFTAYEVGKSTIGTTTFHPTVTTDAYNNRGAPFTSDIIDVGDPRAKDVDLTGGKDLVTYWSKRPNGLSGAYTGVSGQSAGFLDPTTFIIFEPPPVGIIKTITFTAVSQSVPLSSVDAEHPPWPLPGQGHLLNAVIGKGGNTWFWVVQDFDPPTDLTDIYRDVGINPDGPGYPFTKFSFKGTTSTYLRVFDKTGEEVTRIPWGTSGGHKEYLDDSGLPFVDRYHVGTTDRDVHNFPTEFLSVLAPIQPTAT